jgi:hypothetical protein
VLTVRRPVKIGKLQYRVILEVSLNHLQRHGTYNIENMSERKGATQLALVEELG